MVWNRRRDGRFHKIIHGQAVDRENVHGARLVPNPKEDWIVVRDAHPALISRRLFEQTKQRLQGHPKSIEQRQRFSKPDTHGKTWNGQRSRFILSGLVRCSLCGSRYQGVTKAKGKKRLDGTSVKTFYYGCGGYITKGKSICDMNAIPQKVLEERVIEVVLDFCKPYLEKGGRKKLAQAVKDQIGSEAKEFVAARTRAQRELKKIDETINNLLDNITSANRQFVDRRLGELQQEKLQLESRLEELDRLSLSRDEINSIVSDSMKFLAGLEFVLREGVPQEKLVALRRCVEKIDVDKPSGQVKLAIYLVPIGNLQTTRECTVSI
jgi:hypothetical protein